MKREQVISGKCEEAGCSKEEARRHFQFYVHENWDVHPPDEFSNWWQRHPEAASCKPVTAWNSDRNRKQFAQWNDGESEPSEPELTEEQRQAGLKFLAQLRVRTHQRGGAAE